MIIKVLGPGCRNARTSNAATRQLRASGLTATIEKVTDYPTIVGYGVMATPALVVDQKLLVTGRVLTPGESRWHTAHRPDDAEGPWSGSWSTTPPPWYNGNAPPMTPHPTGRSPPGPR